MSETRRLSLAIVAIVFLAVTVGAWAGVTGPGTTGSETTPPPATTLPESAPGPAPGTVPPSTTEVPEAPPLEKAARDLGDREPEPVKARQRTAAKPDKAKPAGGSGWKAAKKAAKAECKRRYTGRERGQCISAAARAHKNPKARGRR